MPPRLATAGDVDFDEIARFQRRCFQGHPGEEERTSAQTADYYLWKYTLLQPARIAEYRHDGELLAMCAAFPLQIRRGEGSVTGWQICDIATAPASRGHGLFTACLAALSQSLPAGDVFFGFPNKNSAPRLAALGWQTAGKLRPFAGILPAMTASSNIQRIDRFEDGEDPATCNAAPSGGLQIARTAAYLTARYCSPLRPIYACYAVRNGSTDCGWIVLRTLRLFGLKVSVIMDVFAIDAAVRRMLVRHAGFWSGAQGCLATVSFSNEWNAMELSRCGLFAVPGLAISRQLNLMVSDRHAHSGQQWQSRLGDWDGL